MSVWVMGWVFANVGDLSPAEKLLLLSIADEADDHGVNAFPGMRRLAEKTNQSVGGVRQQVTRLEQSGHLVVLRPEKQGRGHYNQYGVVMDRLPAEVLAIIERGNEVDPSDEQIAQETRVKGTQRRAKGNPQSAHTQDPIPNTQASSAEQQPLVLVQEVEAAPRAGIGFDEFWAAYPHKRGKTRAEQLWDRLDDDEHLHAIGAIPAYQADCEALNRNLQQGDTYLSKQTFVDYPITDPQVVDEPVEETEPCPACNDKIFLMGDDDVAVRCDACRPEHLRVVPNVPPRSYID